ncbi:MAG: sulfite exporter TauE/SafE family protein [Solirubrobacterales bacterium]
MDPLLVLFGLGVGVLVGTTGMGGGSLMTPLLIIVFGVKPVVAIGTDLAYAAVTKTVGAWRHLRKGTVFMPLTWWMATGSIPGALGGVVVLEWLHGIYGASFDNALLIAIAGALLLTAAAVLARALLLPDAAASEREGLDLDPRHKAAAVATGLIVGFVLGATSAGSGALIAVALIMIFRLTPVRVVGTDVFHAAILLWVAAAAHLFSGNVDVPLALNILVGSVPGVWIGAGLASQLRSDTLRIALGVVLVASSLGLLSKADIGIPAWLLLAVPAALGLIAFLLHTLRDRKSPPPTVRAAASTPPRPTESAS